MNRTCDACGFQAKKYGSLEKHINHCKVIRGIKRRKIAREEIYLPEDKIERLRAGLDNDTRDIDAVEFENSAKSFVDDVLFFGDEHQADAVDHLASFKLLLLLTDANKSVQTKPSFNPEILHPSLPPQSLPVDSSTSPSLRVEQYRKVTGRHAGEPLTTGGEPNCEDASTSEVSAGCRDAKAPYSPFNGREDWDVAKFMHDQSWTKGAVDLFLQNETFKAKFGGQLSYKNAEEWRQQISRIPWGIQDDKFYVETFKIKSLVDGAKEPEYMLMYRDIVAAIRFLLGHKPFREHMVYAPVQVFTPNNDRVYSDMYTGDWWWNMQEQLPDGATVVPLLLATDKTVLTQHHGDLSLWPVYLTIGNLDRTVRRSQKRPGIILLGLLSVAKLGDEFGRHVRSELYHECMGLILKRTSPFPLSRART